MFTVYLFDHLIRHVYTFLAWERNHQVVDVVPLLGPHIACKSKCELLLLCVCCVFDRITYFYTALKPQLMCWNKGQTQVHAFPNHSVASFQTALKPRCAGIWANPSVNYCCHVFVLCLKPIVASFQTVLKPHCAGIWVNPSVNYCCHVFVFCPFTVLPLSKQC